MGHILFPISYCCLVRGLSFVTCVTNGMERNGLNDDKWVSINKGRSSDWRCSKGHRRMQSVPEWNTIKLQKW
jgi:hypothetical protein